MSDIELSADTAYGSALISWHSMFMGVALMAAARSKDHRARNGACIASSENRILGVGYNGLPRGCDDSDPAYWYDEDDNPVRSRHSYIVHAEINAILNCAVLPLTNATIYTTQFPCPRCAQSIIQVGIRHVVFLLEKSHHDRQGSAVQKMFRDAGIISTSLALLDPTSGSCAESLRTHLFSYDKNF